MSWRGECRVPCVKPCKHDVRIGCVVAQRVGGDEPVPNYLRALLGCLSSYGPLCTWDCFFLSAFVFPPVTAE